MKVILLEADRVVGRCIRDELSNRNIDVVIVSNADEAIKAADEHVPDVVITELGLPSHSGSEFLYEFRTYTDWREVPVIIFSSVNVPKVVLRSKDWSLLNIAHAFYKPDDSLQKLGDAVESVVKT